MNGLQGLFRTYLVVGGSTAAVTLVASLVGLWLGAYRSALVVVASVGSTTAIASTTVWGMNRMGALPEASDFNPAGMPLVLPPAKPPTVDATAEAQPETPVYPPPADAFRQLPQPTMAIAVPAEPEPEPQVCNQEPPVFTGW